jgi:hypothetical protein
MAKDAVDNCFSEIRDIKIEENNCLNGQKKCV